MINTKSYTNLIILLIGIICGLIIFIYLKIWLINPDEFNKNTSQFIAISPTDEYVVTDFVTKEEFTKNKINWVGRWPIGDASVEISLVAHFKYFVKLSEIKHHVENGIVTIDVQNLYLSTPVAFDFSSVTESKIKNWFGTDDRELLNLLKQEITTKLIRKGNLHTNIVYDKAAKSLADNFNNYFIKNGFGKYYKSIVVNFINIKNMSLYQYNYKNSYCGNEPCLLEIDLGRGKILSIQ